MTKKPTKQEFATYYKVQYFLRNSTPEKKEKRRTRMREYMQKYNAKKLSTKKKEKQLHLIKTGAKLK